MATKKSETSIDTTHLRKIELDSFPSIKSPLVTILRIQNGVVNHAHGVGDKRELFGKMQLGDTFIAIWTGQYHSDAFCVTNLEIRAWLSEL